MIMIPDRMRNKKNLICVCVDDKTKQDLQGRIYHGYCEKEIAFRTIVEVIDEMEKVFEAIRYPQSTVRIRQFIGEQTQTEPPKIEREMSNERLLTCRGNQATFLIAVEGRRNASWQGQIYWVEKEMLQEFDSEMEMLSFMAAG